MYRLASYASVVHVISIQGNNFIAKKQLEHNHTHHMSLLHITTVNAFHIAFFLSSWVLAEDSLLQRWLSRADHQLGDNSQHFIMGTHKGIISAPITTHSLGGAFKTVNTTEEPEK